MGTFNLAVPLLSLAEILQTVKFSQPSFANASSLEFLVSP